MITVQRAVSAKGVPAPGSLRRYARAALNGQKCEITLRVVGEPESRRLNRRYRGKNQPTNVLSFPYENPWPQATPTVPRPAKRGEGRAKGGALGGVRGQRGPAVMGDLVICANVVNREAREQNKPSAAHWAHMVVHGVLHLCGLDHIKSSDARVMENHERAILAALSFLDP